MEGRSSISSCELNYRDVGHRRKALLTKISEKDKARTSTNPDSRAGVCLLSVKRASHPYRTTQNTGLRFTKVGKSQVLFLNIFELAINPRTVLSIMSWT